MARQKRIHYIEAIYHVMLRGNYQQTIFTDDVERMYFYSLLQKMVGHYDCKIHLFCLMSNHVHLVIEVKNIPLSKIMQTLSSNFSNYANKKNKRIGHLFQGRYKAKLVQNERYLLELCYYIHFNPVSAKMVIDVDLYPWSSHLNYLGKNIIPWIATEYINSILFTVVQAPDGENYAQFIKNKVQYLGDLTFCEFSAEGDLIINDNINNKIRGQLTKNFTGLTIYQILTTVCRHLGIHLNNILPHNHHRKINLARSITGYFAHYLANYYIKDIADFFERNPESVSRTMHRALRTHLQKPAMKIIMADIETDLSHFNHPRS